MLASEVVRVLEREIRRNGDLDLQVTDEFNMSEPVISTRLPHGQKKMKILIGFTQRKPVPGPEESAA